MSSATEELGFELKKLTVSMEASSKKQKDTILKANIEVRTANTVSEETSIYSYSEINMRRQSSKSKAFTFQILGTTTFDGGFELYVRDAEGRNILVITSQDFEQLVTIGRLAINVDL